MWRSAFHINKNAVLIMNQGGILLPNTPKALNKFLRNYYTKGSSPYKAFQKTDFPKGMDLIYSGPKK